MSSDFLVNKWNETESRIIKGIELFNTEKLENMELGYDNAKSALKSFFQIIRDEGAAIREAFRSRTEPYLGEIEKMAKGIETAKKNAKVVASKKQQVTEGKESLQANLNQAIVRQKPNVKWEDIAGLDKAKQALQEAVILPIKFPQIFVGQRKPWKGILLYGPPGTGKTYLAKACATQMEKGTFFSVSSSDIMSRYVGQSQKVIKTLFAMARKEKPSIIFIDQIDSMAGNRSEGQNQASRRVKTQFLVQMEGVGNQGQGILVLGATNTPWSLDPAIRRRFERRVYIPLPEQKARLTLFKKLCEKTPNNLDEQDFMELAKSTEGYSGSDISTLVRDAAYEPLRICQNANKFRKTKNEKEEEAWTPVPPSENLPGQKYVQTSMEKLEGRIVLPPLQYEHFLAAIMRTKASVSQADLHRYVKFTSDYGQEG